MKNRIRIIAIFLQLASTLGLASFPFHPVIRSLSPSKYSSKRYKLARSARDHQVDGAGTGSGVACLNVAGASFCENETYYQPLFKFDELGTTAKFGRIDDVIMGGVSSSSFVNEPTGSYAKWFGICRVEGGGFCGFRTLPFEEALDIGDADGFYFKCRLVSDDEPERRVWKMTTRAKNDRGEQLYQARYLIPNKQKLDDDGWTVVEVPFDSFQLVRGPITVPNGPAFNKSAGIYQIGMTMSKFEMAQNVTELKNFRPGFFEYHLQSIGLYKKADKIDYSSNPPTTSVVPRFMSDEQQMKKDPIILQVVRQIGGALFSEQSQRRKVAMRLLREKRGLSRIEAILFGLRRRVKSQGVLAACSSFVTLLLVDTARSIIQLALRMCLFLPIRLLFTLRQIFLKQFQKPKLVGN